MKPVIYIMGVAGSGKTTIGKLLSAETGLPFFDADDFHPVANKAKMKAAQPLTDEDREPWLEKLNAVAAEQAKVKGAIIACSSLKEKYRIILSSGIAKTYWIFLQGNYNFIRKRMEGRSDHYMPVQLLQSQFDSLEMPASAFTVDIENEPAVIISTILQYLNGKQW